MYQLQEIKNSCESVIWKIISILVNNYNKIKNFRTSTLDNSYSVYSVLFKKQSGEKMMNCVWILQSPLVLQTLLHYIKSTMNSLDFNCYPPHQNAACLVHLPGCPFFSSMSGALGPPGYGGGGSLDILAGYVDSSPLGLHSMEIKSCTVKVPWFTTLWHRLLPSYKMF